jgi:hypothetical protein
VSPWGRRIFPLCFIGDRIGEFAIRLGATKGLPSLGVRAICDLRRVAVGLEARGDRDLSELVAEQRCSILYYILINKQNSI